MSDDPRDDYRDAMEKYDQTRIAAANAIRIVRAAAEGLQLDAPTFLKVHFNLANRGIPRDPSREIRCDMEAWPSRSDIAQLLKDWHQAFELTHSAWKQIPLADRKVTIPPPPRMTLEN
jgi:hypothetical protein